MEYKGFLLVRANLRRAKGQTAALAVLIFLASFMLNLWLMLAMDYKQNFDRYHDKLHAEHVTLDLYSGDGGMRAFLEERLKQDARVTDFCLDSVYNMVGSFAYHDGEINSDFVCMEKQTALTRAVGRAEIVEDSGFTSGVYLPMLYQTQDIAVGKTVALTIGSKTRNYTVCGFTNSVMAGSHNCSMCLLLFTPDQYEKLQENKDVVKGTLCSVRIRHKDESESFEAELKNQLSEAYPDVRALSNSYSLVSTSRYIAQMICSGIISVMAFFVLLIALVVIVSNIRNDIQENMKNLGSLKAVGYTGRQLLLVFFQQFLGISVLAAAIGAALSYGLFPFVNAMMTAQTGIPYRMRFLPLPFLGTLAVICAAVAGSVWLAAHRVRKIEPITALRRGIQTHNFCRNHVPLESAKIPLHAALALKTTFSQTKQNVTVCVTMLVLSLVTVFCGVMYANMIVDKQPFVDLIVGETADLCLNITADPQTEEAFLQDMNQDPRVEKIYLYHSVGVRHVGGIELTATISDDFAKVNNQKVCIEGRFPKYENEVAVAAKYAKEKGLALGDEIILTVDGKKADYLIAGFTQISNNLGKDCLLTRAGFKRMGVFQDFSYYLNLADGVDSTDFQEEAGRRFAGNINGSVDIRAVVEGSASVYVSIMTIIVEAIFVLSIIVIAFVLYLLVRAMLGRKRRDYGVLKALGFTTGQLILQTAGSFLPALVLSLAAGLVLSGIVINPLLAVFLSGIGILKCTFLVPAGFIALAGSGLVSAAFGIACLLSLRIRRIVPRDLLADEA
ncbi:MAG: ABC transporter permease [Eubacterium sp.]|nr:ABC transporter permease [Eubacterium sp.]